MVRILLVALVLSAASLALAGTIVQPPAPVAAGPGLGTVAVPAIVTVQPNNDDVPSPNFLDNNIFVPIKRFDFNGNIDIEFFVVPSGGVTEYQVFESVDNNTGVPWNNYVMMLGHGLGPLFVPSLPGDGLDFDTGPPGGNNLPPVSSAMPLVARPNEDVLVFSGGLHGAGAESYQFRVDVPDVPTPAPFMSRFTIRQIPRPVPEPSAIMLVSMALVGAMAYRSRG
jgi:hypothetical protein